MPASQEQKVDFLLKKIGYSASKTGVAEDESTIGLSTNTAKKPFEEGIASPLVIPSTTILSDSSFIPTTPPGSDTLYVKGYRTATALRMTRDSTVGTNTRTYIAYTTYNDTSSARLTNWIDTQFGSNYIIKVYKGDPNSSGVELQQAGGNAGTDGWFFDYSSGVLNFNGINLPDGVTATNIYIVGYRYIGATGVQPPAGIGTFHDLIVHNNFKVSGISTFNGLVDVNAELNTTGGRIVGAATSNIIPSLFSNYSDLPSASTYHGAFAHVHGYGKGYFAHAGNWMELVNKETTGIVGTGTERYDIGYLDATNLYVSGITTLGSIGISTGLISGPAITYIDPATVGDDTGTLVVKGNLQVEGTQTTVNSTTMNVADKNVGIASGAANDAAADGAGLTVYAGSDTDKTWNWVDATDSWTSSEHIRIPDGKVFGFTPDTNTHISRPAADQLLLTTGGTGKARFITTQTKIGPDADSATTSTNYEFQISGYSTGNCFALSLKHGTSGVGKNLRQAFFFKNDGGTSVDLARFQATCTANAAGSESGDLAFYTTNAGTSGEKLRILSNGNVGINSTAPTAKLDVVGATILQGNLNVTGITTSARLNVTGITTTLQLQVGTTGQTLVGITTILDEDNMASNSATALVTQQSLVAYVGNSAPGGSSLAVSADSGSNESINLATEVLDIEGTANEIETATGTNKVVIGLPDNVSIGGTLNVGVGLSVVGVSTFAGDIYANSGTIQRASTGSKLILNSSTETRFYHSSGNKVLLSFYNNSGFTGSIDAHNGAIVLYNGGNKTSAVFRNQGAAELYYDNAGTSTKRFNTTNTGINVTGLTDTDTLTTGDATFTGTISAGSTTGTDGYYLKTTGIGVTWAAFPSSRTTSTQTATAGQTSFNFSYNVGFVDVFVNGVKLPESEFTASNGSTIVLDDAAFENDTLEFISLNTVPVTSGGGASNLTGLADVTITGAPVVGETLQHNGSAFVNDYTPSTTTTSTSQTAILSLPIATYRSAEYTIQITEGTKYHVTKVLAIHDGTNATFNEYGTLFTTSSLSTFALDVSSGNMRLLATPASTNSTVFKVKFTGIKV